MSSLTHYEIALLIALASILVLVGKLYLMTRKRKES
jgi:hypothetical protein